MNTTIARDLDGLILAIETSTPTARVAVLDGAGVVRATGEETAARHSANLLKLCDQVLREVDVAPARLGAIACGAGPGSFTGLRVGLAVAKGLALPTSRPFVLVSSLAALALDILGATAGDSDVVAAPCIDAGKGQIYAAFFRADADRLVAPIGEEWVLDPDGLAPAASARGELRVAGNGAVRYGEVIDAALAKNRPRARRIDVAGPSAVSLGRLALLRLARGESDNLETAAPSYGRPPDITQPRRRD
jgi:tRNA threonylcarbamoyladenosine biosynthesis protein TsaB